MFFFIKAKKLMTIRLSEYVLSDYKNNKYPDYNIINNLPLSILTYIRKNK